MKRYVLLFVVCFSLLITPALTQAQATSGMSVTCNDGTSFDNGVEVIVSQMRAGYTYTATAVGVNGFDPVLAVLNTQTGQGLCNDDEPAAANYAADLPSSGYVAPSSTSAQLTFHHDDPSGFADMSLVVGGYGNQSGEFLLILEGMGVTDTDGIGDVFKVNITPGMVASGIPLTVYMITRAKSNVDPLVYAADSKLNALTDSSNNDLFCDDAGDSSNCYTPVDLSKSSVTLADGDLATWDKDAALSLDISGWQFSKNPDENYLNYVMTSYKHQTEGQYLIAFDIGASEDLSNTSTGTGLTGGQEQQSTGG